MDYLCKVKSFVALDMLLNRSSPHLLALAKFDGYEILNLNMFL